MTKKQNPEMPRSKSIVLGFSARALLVSLCTILPLQTVGAESNGIDYRYPPVVNGDALRGLSTVGSAESMGAGRITLGVQAPWYKQRAGYLTAPNLGADIFTGTLAFSYGVNSYVDLFGSISGFSSSNYVRSKDGNGLGTIRAGAQGSLPFPRRAFLRMGGQTAIIGGTSNNQINTYRADGFNYFETRTGYDFMGKLLQTVMLGNETFGFKAHLNEAGVLGIDHNQPALLLLGAGAQANIGFIVLGTELNSRTEFSDLAFATDPLWLTPSVSIRTPFMVNAQAGVDLSLSTDRDNGPRALEPYRIFGAVAFSFDALAGRRLAAAKRKQQAAEEKLALQQKAAQSASEVKALTLESANDSIALSNEKAKRLAQRDSMQWQADSNALANTATTDAMLKRGTSDSLALVAAASDLAAEKQKRSELEKQLLSTGELLLDAVYFETGKTVISINSKPYLNIIGKMLLKFPKLNVEVAGFTDNIGNARSNITLSQGRAESVRNYLIEVEPALSSTLSARGYGVSMPKADNNTEEGRLSNRRVELRVLNKDALQQYTQN